MASTSLRVVLAANFARDEKLGTSRVPLRLAAELERMGAEVCLLFAEDLPRVPPGRSDALTAPFRMAATLAKRARSADVVDIAGFDAWAYARLARRWRPRQAIVSRSNGLWYKALAANGDIQQSGSIRHLFGRVYRQVFCRWERASIMASDVVLFGAHGDGDEVVRRGWRTPEGVAVVSPGVDDFFSSTVPLDRRRNVAVVGTFFHRKGCDIVAASMSRVLLARPNLGLTIFGAGVPASAVLSSFEDRVRSQVTVIEAVPPRRLAEQLADFAVLLFPTRYEGFGMVVLEAMRAGLAVVTTPTGAGADIVRNDENGLVVPFEAVDATADAVARVVDDLTLRTRLASAAIDDARGRSWERTANELVQAYERARSIAARRLTS